MTRAVFGRLAAAAAFLCLLTGFASGAYLVNVPQVLRQPDGAIVRCFASGDEHANWLHDAEGYTILQDPATGFYVYAARSSGGVLLPTAFIAGRTDPATAGLEKGLRPPVDEVRRRRAGVLRVQGGTDAIPAPRKGSVNNIVVFIRFQYESEFTDPVSLFDGMFNASATSANSLRNYFRECSYNTLAIQSTFYPASSTTVVSYQDAQPRAYYQPYNEATNPTGYQTSTQERDREHLLLRNAVVSVAGQVPAGLNLDADADGLVDSVVFIVSGSPTGWSSLLWPHMWALYSQMATLNGKRVWSYNFQLRSYVDNGVLCHEMHHTLGLPDLYHYQGNGISPVGRWDVMEWDLDPPQHTGAYMKWRYGSWIAAIPEITSAGTYTLNPLTSSTSNAYKIRSPNSTTEFFILEYRRRAAPFESSLPGDGLLVYRINSARDGQGNANGPPDEVYVYRPNGTPTANGSPDAAFFSSGAGRTSINDSTNPSSFLAGGSAGGLNISNIGPAGATISFTVSFAPVAGPRIGLSRTKLVFGSAQGSGTTPAQTVGVSNTGEGTLSWTAAANRTWISVAPASGGSGGLISVSVNPSGLGAGTYTGQVSVSDPGATNSPQAVDVTLNVYNSGASSAPFGTVDTPTGTATLSGSVPVTGWALDDVEVANVKIWRNGEPGEVVQPNGYVYIGLATFVDGARRDVEQAFPSYPLNRRGGWGYMLLTNFLPRGGNGTYVLRATATDKEGRSVELGAKTVAVNNAAAVLPFGTIDTPTQGGTAAGGAFLNFGWALTPLPNMVPVDGSTIQVWVDGVAIGRPTYNQYRSDIASLFPGYANSGGAVGYFHLDTTKYADGIHTIAWSVRDNAGNENGIGSRFFTVANGSGAGQGQAQAAGMGRRKDFALNFRRPVSVRTGFGRRDPPRLVFPGRDDVIRVEVEEAGRVEVRLVPEGAGGKEPRFAGALAAGPEFRPLPPGSTFGPEAGTFVWQPGPGFLGAYDFVFADEKARVLMKVTIRIVPRGQTGERTN